MKFKHKKVNHIQNPYQTWNCLKRKYIKGDVAHRPIRDVEWGIEQIIHPLECERWMQIDRIFEMEIENEH